MYPHISVLLLAICLFLSSSESLSLYLTSSTLDGRVPLLYLTLDAHLFSEQATALSLLPYYDLLPQSSLRCQKIPVLVFGMGIVPGIQHPQPQELLSSLCNYPSIGVGKPGLSLLIFQSKKYLCCSSEG